MGTSAHLTGEIFYAITLDVLIRLLGDINKRKKIINRNVMNITGELGKEPDIKTDTALTISKHSHGTLRFRKSII